MSPQVFFRLSFLAVILRVCDFFGFISVSISRSLSLSRERASALPRAGEGSSHNMMLVVSLTMTKLRPGLSFLYVELGRGEMGEHGGGRPMSFRVGSKAVAQQGSP